MKLKTFTIFVSTLQTSAVINDPENDPIVIIPSSASPRWLLLIHQLAYFGYSRSG